MKAKSVTSCPADAIETENSFARAGKRPTIMNSVVVIANAAIDKRVTVSPVLDSPADRLGVGPCIAILSSFPSLKLDINSSHEVLIRMRIEFLETI
ncbi:hypothetical protein AA103587_0842 [Gluconobacter kanchanaburiensis NBRC 103587]|nr:hypothetical protein AA103587_0842 [Gluconobacter kanchanaburiensis NBRC 103587]